MNAIATTWNVTLRMASRSKHARRYSRTNDAQKQHTQGESQLTMFTARHLTCCLNKNDARNVITGTDMSANFKVSQLLYFAEYEKRALFANGACAASEVTLVGLATNAVPERLQLMQSFW